MKAFVSTALLITLLISPLAAQTSTVPQNTKAATSTASQRDAAAPNNTTADSSNSKTQQETAALPAEYRGIQLGMNIDTVKEALKNDSIFGYRGERDVSLLPVENRSLIESAGLSFISRSWFQFYKENLYTMIFKLNTDRVDYYSIYAKFCEKYGEPVSINPQRAVWENETTRIVIERPLIVKYIDLTVFNELLSQSTTDQAASSVNRQSFIDGF